MCLVAGCAGHQRLALQPFETSADGHVKLYYAGDLTESLSDQIKLVETYPPAFGERSTSLIVGGGRQAFVTDEPGEDAGHVQYLYVQRGDQLYRVEGVPMGHRPITGILWRSYYRVQFDRWSNPHFGVRYVIDVQNKRLEMAHAFADEHYIRSAGGAELIE